MNNKPNCVVSHRRFAICFNSYSICSFIPIIYAELTNELVLHVTGVPDPPLNVQVEAGPREGTLLLTWLPVTINSSGFSNGAVVTGYVVYADGRRIKEVKGPTSEFSL